MKKGNTLIRFYTHGGIVSPGELRKIATTAFHYGCEDINLGKRQDVYFEINKKYITDTITRLGNVTYAHDTDLGKINNIVTSVSAKDIAKTVSWFTEGIYYEIISGFDFQPKLKVNITDPLQALSPLFTGELNFVASVTDEGYFYCYVNLNHYKGPELWPVLVYYEDISHLVKIVEVIAASNPPSNKELMELVYGYRTWNFRNFTKVVEIPKHHNIPNFEGIHEYGEKYWLGIYNRENKFSVTFLDALSLLCSETNIGSLYITSWRSLIIKNISEKDLYKWYQLLGKYGINTDHSALDLNWRLPDSDPSAVKLKKYLVNAFSEKDIRTEGLVFSIRNKPERNYASVIIDKVPRLIFGNNIILESFHVKYKEGFDPNSSREVSFAEFVNKNQLVEILSYICSLYYEGITKDWNKPSEFNNQSAVDDEVLGKEVKKVYQCSSCMGVYDPEFGDEEVEVTQGTSFELLPESYCCSVCNEPKKGFVEKDWYQLIELTV